MKRWTQANLDPGNCWQTAVACILGVDPEGLPDQVEIESAHRSYHNALNSYLMKHRNLNYFELFSYQFPAVTLRRGLLGGYHILAGPTVRTPENDQNHVVVARFGRPVWDPHPSRSGLVEVERWGIIGPATASQLQHRAQYAGEDTTLRCLCPDCATERLAR